MKKKFTFILVVLISITYAQNSEVSIVLKDAASNLPIEDATVFVVKTKQSYLSNIEGQVTFVLNGTSNIQITHASYSSTTIRSSTLKEKVNTVLLKATVTNLDEIVITKQHPQKILKAIVQNSMSKLSVPARLKVYSREFFKLNGNYSYYNDGLLNFQISGKEKDFKTDILVEQNRSFGLIDFDVSNDLLGYNLNDIMQNYCAFKYLNPVLEPRAKKEYDFIIKTYNTNKEYYLMKVTPVDQVKDLLDEFTILYDKKKKLIIEISAVLSPAIVAKVKDKKAVGAKNIYKSFFKTIYRFDDSNYYLLSSKEEIGYERVDKKGTTDIEVRNYFITTNFSNQKFSFNQNDTFKDKTLFNKKNVILTDYWNSSGITATEEEEKIINSIEEQH